jgi:hypothetical protein
MANVTVRSNPCGPVMRTRNPPLNGSASIHASCGPVACLPPATTAASTRSRRAPGTPLMSKTMSGIKDILAGNGGQCDDSAALKRAKCSSSLIRGIMLRDEF